ncbi:hypothetical protein [Roseimaritima sediminicola]|uniref:hypothetical protein n=1 Tax=Roseimaritima sediminicola TaxID=2662066 RepID=UPI0012982991|nr:hypothetical protein [Roseimaritima sediminicola]
MDEPKNNVGRYRFDVAYEKPRKNARQRRIDALRVWLLKQFDRRQTEAVNDESSKG